jgi:hypothetical protein
MILAGLCHPWNSSHWKRRPPLVIPTGISCFALLATTTCAALRKESRMQTIKATDLDRKFRGPELRRSVVDLQFYPLCSLRPSRLNNGSGLYEQPARKPGVLTKSEIRQNLI